MLSINVVVLDGSEDGFPALGFDLPSGARRPVIVRSHLREDAIPKSQWRVAERLQPQAVEQFALHRAPRHNNCGAARTDAFDFSSLSNREAGQAFVDSTHLGPSHHVS